MPSKTHLRPAKSTAYLATFLNTLHWNQGRSRALVPNALESGRGLGKTYFTFYDNFYFISNWIFSIKAKNVKLLRGLKPFSLFVFLPLPVHSKSCPPLSGPFLKLDPRFCNLLLLHCTCIMHSKHRIGRRAVELLEN